MLNIKYGFLEFMKWVVLKNWHMVVDRVASSLKEISSILQHDLPFSLFMLILQQFVFELQLDITISGSSAHVKVPRCMWFLARVVFYLICGDFRNFKSWLFVQGSSGVNRVSSSLIILGNECPINEKSFETSNLVFFWGSPFSNLLSSRSVMSR